MKKACNQYIFLKPLNAGLQLGGILYQEFYYFCDVMEISGNYIGNYFSQKEIDALIANFLFGF